MCGERHGVCLENAEKWLISILAESSTAPDSDWKPELAGALLILTTAFNNPEAPDFGDVLGQA